mgnify:CR=1 FL=1
MAASGVGDTPAPSVVVVEAGGRTRVIVNLVQVMPYEATVSGDELVVSVGGNQPAQYLAQSGSGGEAHAVPARTQAAASARVTWPRSQARATA